MKAKDLRERSPEDLKELEKSLRTDYFQARLKNHTNRLDDTSTIRKSRRDLARVLTIIAAKNTGAATPAEGKAEKPAKKTAKAAVAKAPKAAKAAPKTAKKSAAKKEG